MSCWTMQTCGKLVIGDSHFQVEQVAPKSQSWFLPHPDNVSSHIQTKHRKLGCSPQIHSVTSLSWKVVLHIQTLEQPV